MIGIDTNVLLRYLLDDDLVQSAAARLFFEKRLNARNKGFISLVTLAETVWVLRRQCKASRSEIQTMVEQLLCSDKLHVQESDSVWRALDEYDQTKADFSDTLIVALGQMHGCDSTVTFDAQAGTVHGAQLLM